ncbi:MAG: hypothetical protein K1Y02_12315 [Candidatus Hydrogenedentes bacterium]|nr:hypothetical protein [Candidatus Hydrogenedentota bacterium]
MIQALNCIQAEGACASTAIRQRGHPAETDFAQWFNRELAGSSRVKFSAHATQRLRDRNIALTSADENRLSQAVDQAQAKGARESLILMDRLALVVNVPNRTVITALPQGETQNAVFTNIDSAVVVAGETSLNERAKLQTGLDPIWGSPYAAD